MECMFAHDKVYESLWEPDKKVPLFLTHSLCLLVCCFPLEVVVVGLPAMIKTISKLEISEKLIFPLLLRMLENW